MADLIASALIVYMDTCKICLECFPDVALHVATEHATKGVFECEWCGRKYTTKQVLENHISHSHLSLFGPAFTCEECSGQFYAEGHLKAHLKTQHNIVKPPAKYQCDLCLKHFRLKLLLEEHQRLHKGERPFKCPKCTKSFRVATSLNNHFQKLHDKVPLSYLCEICGRSFLHRHSLISHMAKHQEPTHECSVCGWKTRYKFNLKCHLESHSLKPVHQCEFCDKKFSSSSYFYKHRMKHNEDRPVFTCFLCNKIIFAKENLVSHIKIHQGQFDFECDQCDAAFVNKYRLVRHRFEKHNIKEYKCKICPAQFEKMKQLNIHNHKKHFNMQNIA